MSSNWARAHPHSSRRALQLHGGGRLTSFDQHGGFVDATRQWLADHALDVDIRHAPLNHESADWPGRWYALNDVPDRIDLLIIDGPPWSVHPLVRGAADSLFARLSPMASCCWTMRRGRASGWWPDAGGSAGPISTSA